MITSNKYIKVLVLIIATGLLSSSFAKAESIAWVTDGADNRYDSLGVHVETPFWEMLQAAGYEVEVLVDTMQGSPLSTEQLDLIESFDLIIAADVLYEKRWLKPIINVIDLCLKEDGIFFLAEPNRTIAKRFFDQISKLNWIYHSLLKNVLTGDKLNSVSIHRISKC